MGGRVEAASVENGAATEEETTHLQESSGVAGDGETEDDGREGEYVSLDETGTGTGDDAPEGSSQDAEADMTRQIVALSEALSVDDPGSPFARVSGRHVLRYVTSEM